MTGTHGDSSGGMTNTNAIVETVRQSVMLMLTRLKAMYSMLALRNHGLDDSADVAWLERMATPFYVRVRQSHSNQMPPTQSHVLYIQVNQ